MFPVKESILFTIAALDIILGVAAILRGPKKFVNWAFSSIPFGAAIWAVGLAMLSLTGGSLLWGKVIFGASFFIFPMFVIFSDAFPRKTKFEWWYLLVFLPSIVLTSGLLTGLVLKANIVQEGRILKVTGPLYPVYNIFLLTYLLWTTLNLLSKYRGARALTKLQLYYLLFGFFVFVLFGLITNLILPLLGESEMIMLGPAASLIFITFAAYSILRYRLMDIRDALRQGLMIIILTAAAPPLLFVAYQVIIQVLPCCPTAPLPLAAALTFAILALGGIKLWHPFQKIAERILFRDSYIYHDAVAKLTEIFNKSRSVESLCENLTEALVSILKVDGALFLLRGEDGSRFVPVYVSREVRDHDTFAFDATDDVIVYAQRVGEVFLTDEVVDRAPGMDVAFHGLLEHGIEICVPINIRGELAAMLCLGGKRSGDSYTTRDIHLLEVIADLCGIALENARLYSAFIKEDKS